MAKKSKEADQKPDEYRQAYNEWSKRIGSAKTQARNWRFACLLCFIVMILMLVALIMLLDTQKSYVYVAEVKPQESIVNVRSMTESYTPTQAQEEYFISQFIERTMALPLDPVVLRNRWLAAYGSTEGRAKEQLNAYARKNDPFKLVGKQTATVDIQKYNPISNSSYAFDWVVTTFDDNGKVISKIAYNGIFTLVSGRKPTNQKQLLSNPFGLRVEYFSISSEVNK